MNWFDQPIIQFINAFAHRSWIVDAIINEIGTSNFLDGAVLMSMFWWAWIQCGQNDPKKRQVLAANLGLCTVAVVLARILALVLPYRERPVHNPMLHFTEPYATNSNALIHWSSFPSDHAVLAFCIATGLWFVSRRLGALALAYAFITNVPRIYIGAHYPTDLIAGALLGASMASLSKAWSLRRAARTGLEFMARHPPYVYALLFAWTFEIAEMFDSLRQLAVVGVKGVMQAPASQVEIVGVPILVLLTVLLIWLRWQRHRQPTVETEPAERASSSSLQRR